MGVFPGFSGQKFIDATYERCNAGKRNVVDRNTKTLIEGEV